MVDASITDAVRGESRTREYLRVSGARLEQCLHDAFVFVSMCAWLAGLAHGGRSGLALHEWAATTFEKSLL